MKVVSETNYRRHTIKVKMVSDKYTAEAYDDGRYVFSSFGSFYNLDDVLEDIKSEIDKWIKMKIKKRQRYFVEIHSDDTIEIIARHNRKTMYRGESISDANVAVVNYLAESEKYINEIYPNS